MQRDKNIWLELKEISPLLAGIEAGRDAYQAPAGYFERLPGEVLARIRALGYDSPARELPDISPLVSSLPREIPFGLPASYFDQFPEKMVARVMASDAEDARKELEEISPLLGRLDKQGPYITPDGYFEKLAGELSLAMDTDSAAGAETEKISPVLSGLEKTAPYAVPENYFESFPEKMLAAVKTPGRSGRIISFSSLKPWMKYAAAACLTGILLTIGLFTFERHANVDPLAGLAKASDQEIVNFLANQDILLSEKLGNSMVSSELSENDVRDLFDQVPDADLQQYVNERNGSKDLITN